MSALPAAGWFPDPDDPHRFRWWNGTQWTTQSKAAGPGIVQEGPTAAQLHADDAAWQMFPDRIDGEHAGWNAERLAVDDRRRAGMWRRRLLVATAIAALALGAGPFLILIVPAVLAGLGIIWFVKRGGTVRTRNGLVSWATRHGLSDDGGMLLIGDKAPALAAFTSEESIRALRAAGMRIRRHGGARLRGRLWGAAVDATIQSIQGMPEYRHDAALLTVVAVPLDPSIAACFPGLAMELPRVNRKFQLRGWEPVVLEPGDVHPSARITAHPEQLHPRNYALFTPERLARFAGLDGWVVAEGQLAAWAYDDLLVGIGGEEADRDEGRPAPTGATVEERLARMLDQVRELHRALYAEG